MKFLLMIFGFIAVMLGIGLLMNSCDGNPWDNQIAKHWGGTITINVEEGKKVTEATWKDDELWYLTEPMDSNYIPVDKEFVEHSEYGILEGKVVFKESK